MKRAEIIKELEKSKSEVRSKWRKGVREYAIERIEEMENGTKITWYTLLNGALWQEKQATFENISSACNSYSWGGCSLIYDIDIAERLATKSEMYTRAGNLKERANKGEAWLDCQARAIYQAFTLLIRKYKNEIIED